MSRGMAGGGDPLIGRPSHRSDTARRSQCQGRDAHAGLTQSLKLTQAPAITRQGRGLASVPE